VSGLRTRPRAADTAPASPEPAARKPSGQPARAAEANWPATCETREQILQRLNAAPVAQPAAHSQQQRNRGLGMLLDWLEEQPGDTWQERWLLSGAESAGASWRELARRSGSASTLAPSRQWILSGGLLLAVSGDIVRPSLPWLIGTTFRRGHLLADLSRCRDPEGFARLRSLCESDGDLSQQVLGRTLYRAALIVAAKGGLVREITTGDLLELFDVEYNAYGHSIGNGGLFYRLLRTLGAFGPDAPTTLRELRRSGQLTPADLIDRYELTCRPIRDLIVDYLCERQPALDYGSLVSLSNFLGRLFWADLERHHPGIDSLHLPADVAAAWKQRLRTTTKTVTSADGTHVTTAAPRINYRECLTPVRAFYLDLAHWAVEDPARWAQWVAPSPVGAEEISRRKATRHRKARMDARTRARLPVLPTLVRSVGERRHAAARLLQAARAIAPGEQFHVDGATWIRSKVKQSAPGRVWAHQPGGKRRDLVIDEDNAFWAWATVEVLRATGVRAEELLEISHHSLVQYRLPTTGELVPLLQIAPSKTDTERMLVVSPELADVLSTIIARVRGRDGTLPLVAAYDNRERVWSAPTPLLFQRRRGSEDRAINACAIRSLLIDALAATGLTDAAGAPLHFTPHDFRRMFITDVVRNGLPPHIAQMIAGHRDINVTLGYKAIYPEETIHAHLAFLARRRALRPSEEYRVPTDEEWEQFLGHFERRKVSIGTCGRAFDTPCIHEHACVRCALLWPDPAQRSRLVEIRDNLQARIAEAKREGWLGEVEGLQVSLAGAEQKLTQLDQRAATKKPTPIGIPVRPAT
jgi:integrase